MNQAVKREAETSTLHHRNHGIAYNVPLARYTRFRVGGTADIAFTPENPDDLAAFLRDLPADVPLTILGLGSNVLIRDGGIRGAVILFSDMRADPIYYQEKIYAPAGLATPKLARFAASLSYKDSAFLSGIPGTVGGALAMNAGCYGEDTWSHVEKVEVLQRNGIPRTRTKDDYEIGYRHVALKNTSDTVLPEIFLGAWFSFTRDETVNAVEEIKTLLAKRAATQPLNVPNAGSVFRNPTGDHAGRLIEACGLKGKSIGGARVSEKHANFIVNEESQATAADIEALMLFVKEEVKQQTGTDLIPEIRVLGETL